MGIDKLNKRSSIEENKRLNTKYVQFEKLISELEKRELPNEIINSINEHIKKINSISHAERELKKQLRKSQTEILKLIEKELKLVTKNQYRNIGLAIGISMGTTFGVVFGATSDNMGFIGMGMPIGMAIGIAIGTVMDKKAKDSGNQLDLEVNY